MRKEVLKPRLRPVPYMVLVSAAILLGLNAEFWGCMALFEAVDKQDVLDAKATAPYFYPPGDPPYEEDFYMGWVAPGPYRNLTVEDGTYSTMSANLVNYALYAAASGMNNVTEYALFTDKGAVQINGNTTLGDDNADVTTIHGRLMVDGMNVAKELRRRCR